MAQQYVIGETRLGELPSLAPRVSGTCPAPNPNLGGPPHFVDGCPLPAAGLNLTAPLNSPGFTGNPTAPTPSAANISNSIATTAWANNAIIAAGSSVATGNTGQVAVYGSPGKSVVGYAIGGDATAAISGSNLNLTVLNTAGVPFAPSATTNALNASNISSGTLGAARLPPLSFTMLGGQATLGQLPQIGSNTVLGSLNGTDAAITLPAGCKAINWVTSTGFSCAAINPINVLSLGADPTNTNDNLSIISGALGSGKTALYFPAGTYKFSGALTSTLADQTPVTLIGDGTQSILSFPNGGGVNILEPQNPGDPLVPYMVHNLQITTATANPSGSGLSFTNTQQSSFAPSQIVDIQNVEINATGSGYWSNCLALNYVSNLSAVNLTTNNGGYQGNSVYLQSSVAAPGIVYNITNSNLNFSGNGLLYGNGIQGVTLSQDNFLDKVDVAVPPGESGLDQLTIIGSQFNTAGVSASEYAMNMSSPVANTIIENNLFAVNSASGTVLYMPANGGSLIIGNHFGDVNCSGSPCGTGINLGASQTGAGWSGNTIADNQFDYLATAINLGAGSVSQIYGDNVYNVVTNPVSNSSTNTFFGLSSPWGGGIGEATNGINMLAPSGGTIGLFSGSTLGAEITATGQLYAGNGAASCSGPPDSNFRVLYGIVTSC